MAIAYCSLSWEHIGAMVCNQEIQTCLSLPTIFKVKNGGLAHL